MSESAVGEGASHDNEKPVADNEVNHFPPFPDPLPADFDEDITEDEISHYKNKFKDINTVTTLKLHCTACDKHMGCKPRNDTRLRMHPMLRTLICNTCHTFYNSGEFEKGDDGSELYCRWCGQGGQVYCCCDCQHVFCAKCIKRNMGVVKIKEIEHTDDWKCFKCNPLPLWDLRATCWALLRYCELRNRFARDAPSQDLKDAYEKENAKDVSTCCANKNKRRESKKKESENTPNKSAAVLTKIPSTIQVKKFASIPVEDLTKEIIKRPPKRLNSSGKNQISIMPGAKLMKPLLLPVGPPPLSVVGPKKMRLPTPSIPTPGFQKFDRKTYQPTFNIRPKFPQIPLIPQYNGFNQQVSFNNNPFDNINLSLESLTQGLDMSAVAGMTSTDRNDDVICTPDFPLEPLEVLEDNDDDVECITPGPVKTSNLKVTNNASPLASKTKILNSNLHDLSPENIVQMTENDVTVNAATGGLKFRVDPQTLSSNKMYRLPDGRIFAINSNPNMPGGYSATIVAVTETGIGKSTKGATYAAKLSAVSSTPNLTVTSKRNRPVILKSNKSVSKSSNTQKPTSNKKETTSRTCDMEVPVEWFRFNVIEAVDSLEYSLYRLQKLKTEATTMFLRSRNVTEMQNLHKNLDRILQTSCTRFKEIKANVNNGFKQYLAKKSGKNDLSEEDDDDVEILPNNDDPIFIDENSSESTEAIETEEVDLTDVAFSDHNDSGEKNTRSNLESSNDLEYCDVEQNGNLEKEEDKSEKEDDKSEKEDDKNEKEHDKNEQEDVKNDCKSEKESHSNTYDEKSVDSANTSDITTDNKDVNCDTLILKNENVICNETIENDTNFLSRVNENGESDKESFNKSEGSSEQENTPAPENVDENSMEISNIKIEDTSDYLKIDNPETENDEKIQDVEMSEDMIETLLKDVNEETKNVEGMDTSDLPEV